MMQILLTADWPDRAGLEKIEKCLGWRETGQGDDGKGEFGPFRYRGWVYLGVGQWHIEIFSQLCVPRLGWVRNSLKRYGRQ